MDKLTVVIKGVNDSDTEERLLRELRDGDISSLTGAIVKIEVDESKRVVNKDILGKFARDKITGFEGIITGHAKHLYSCDTYGITPRMNKDGKMQDPSWFDEGRLEITGKGVNPDDVRAEKNGAGGNPKNATNNPR